MVDKAIEQFAKKYKIDISDFGLVDNIVDKSFKKIVTIDVIPGFNWYLFTNLRIRESYARGRKWSIEDCIRDLLQNALDESGEKAKIYYDHEGVHIIDYGSGMPIEAFHFGGLKAEDPCYRGGFGEGLKIAVSSLVMVYGSYVYFIVNDGLAYKLVSRYDDRIGEQVLYLVVGETDRKVKPHGTHVIVTGISGDILNKLKVADKSKELFVIHDSPVVEYDWSKDKYVFVNNYKCKVKYAILDEEDVIYASDLFFTKPSTNDIIGKPTFYGYNLWLTTEYELEPNRKAFKSGGLEYTSAKICLLLSKAPQKYWDNLVNNSISVTDMVKAKIITLEPTFFELYGLPISDCEGALDKLANSLRKLGDNVNLLINDGTYNVDKILHYAPSGSTIIIITPSAFSWDVKRLSDKLPSFVDIVRKHIEEAERKMNSDSLNGTMAHGFAMALLDTIIRSVGGDPNSVVLNLTKSPKDEIAGTSKWNTDINKGIITISYYVNKYNELMVDKNEILRLLVHELAHILPYVSFDFRLEYGVPLRSLDHTEENYERALQYILKKMFENNYDVRIHNILSLGFVKTDNKFTAPVSLEVEIPGKIQDGINKLEYSRKSMIISSIKKIVSAVPKTYYTHTTPQLFTVYVYQKDIEESIFKVVPGFDITPHRIKLTNNNSVISFGDNRMLDYYSKLKITDTSKIYKLIEPTIKSAEEDIKSRSMRGLIALMFIDPVSAKAKVLSLSVNVEFIKEVNGDYIKIHEYLFVPHKGKITYKKEEIRGW